MLSDRSGGTGGRDSGLNMDPNSATYFNPVNPPSFASGSGGGGVPWFDPTGFGSLPADPSAGTGLGPGMQGAGGSAGMTTSQIVQLAARLGIPAAMLIRQLASSPSGVPTAGTGGLSGPMANSLSQTLALLNQRLASTMPVHDAAMRMALALAPNLSAPPSPHMAATTAALNSPPPQISPSANVLAAIQRLAGRVGG